MNAYYSYKNGEKSVNIGETAARVIEISFSWRNRDYCLGTLPMLLRTAGTVEGLTPEQCEGMDKAIKATISAGVKAQLIVKLGRNSWDFTAWCAKQDIERAERMIEFYEGREDSNSMLELFNRDHEEASLRFTTAVARYSVDYEMPEPAAV